MNVKVSRLIGLARRCGRLVSGEAAVREAVRRGRAGLLVLAEDAAPRTARSFRELARAGAVPVITCGSRDELGRLLGSTPRAVAAVIDEHLTRGILEAVSSRERER